ncbi:terminase family protein [Caenibius sp. WL]|uniref:terminase large subunit domain-containing protein n=1 Tax=Caenibius sp. WL TaxID=2872646 RepID=UPI001C997A53|nr:terminase family protein [Caenibius sp. WL]QZP07784.1 terminase family protein [Caenibius sp. WL]QZP09983.1 terminase family protein [Caenibius sp. WL]
MEATERGEIDRLMVFMPPRHGKSEKTTKRFPAWYLGRNPKHQVISASYNSDLATDFGREVKGIISSPEYGDVFGNVGLRQDSRAADRMNTNHGGAYFAVGVGTATTGRGAHLAIIDDPFKDREDADSETQREKVWNWYRSTLFTRLMPGGAIVLVQTRWHEDDLAGRLLEQDGRVEDGGEWTVLELPALDENGKALWPEWYDEAALLRIKNTVGPREWSALYQQKPQPDEGTFFKRDWFNTWDKLPALRYYGTSDYAVTDGGGDYTVHRVWGISPSGDIFRVDGWRGQTASDEWIERKLDLIAKYKPLCWFGEGGVIQKAVEPMLKRRMRERNVHCRLEWLSSVADKPTRARSFQAMAATGRVHFEPGADISEFLVFPAGKHDDDVDTASLIGRAIDQAHPAIVAAQKHKQRRDGYWPQEQADNDWMTV